MGENRRVIRGMLHIIGINEDEKWGIKRMRNDCGVRQAPHEQLKVNRRRVWPHGQIIDREFTGGFSLV